MDHIHLYLLQFIFHNHLVTHYSLKLPLTVLLHKPSQKLTNCTCLCNEYCVVY